MAYDILHRSTCFVDGACFSLPVPADPVGSLLEGAGDGEGPGESVSGRERSVYA